MARSHATPHGNIPFTSEEEAKYDAEEKLAKENLAQFGYINKRKRKFPDYGEQLDLLFHDMTAGKGTKDGEWYKAVAKVKSDNPKPS